MGSMFRNQEISFASTNCEEKKAEAIAASRKFAVKLQSELRTEFMELMKLQETVFTAGQNQAFTSGVRVGSEVASQTLVKKR